MGNNIGQRFEHLIDALQTNKNAFARSIGKSHTMVGLVIEGKSKPSYEVLEAIADAYPKVNPTWLLRGEGEMFRSEQVPSEGLPGDQDTYLQEYLKKLEFRFDSLLSQKDSVIESLQSVIEYQKQLLNSKEKSFLKGVPAEGRIVPFSPMIEKATA